MQIYRGRNQINGYLGMSRSRNNGGVTTTEYGDSSWGQENVLKLIVVMVT